LDKKLHILFLNSWYPSRVLPTSGDFIQRHAEAVATKHKVTAIHIISDTKLKQKIEITDKNINKVRTIIVYLKPTTNPLIKVWRYFTAFKKILKTIGPIDLVHLNVTYPFGLFALYLKHKYQLPFIISEHWSDYQYPLNKRIGKLKKLITQLIVKKSSYVCPVTKHLQKSMIDYGLKGNYFTVPNVVNTAIFNVAKKELECFTISHISNMDIEIKNISGILNVFLSLQKEIKNLNLNLIGEKNHDLINLIEKLNLKNVNLTNQIPHIQIANYLKSSDAFVLFSNYENLPCVILEAFACGVPVISTNVGGISEYFPKDFGYLIKPKDELALTKAILNVYHQKKSFDKNNMHQYADQHFSMNTIAKSFSDLYYKALNKKTC